MITTLPSSLVEVRRLIGGMKDITAQQWEPDMIHSFNRRDAVGCSMRIEGRHVVVVTDGEDGPIFEVEFDERRYRAL